MCQSQTHCTHVIGCIAPVAAGLEAAENELVLCPMADPGDCLSDLARYECSAAPRALVVVQDGRTGEDVVPGAIGTDHRVRKQLSCTVGALRAERSVLCLRYLHRITIHLAAGCLTKAYGRICIHDRLQHPCDGDTIELADRCCIIVHTRAGRVGREVIELCWAISAQ